ncbi:ESPR-type extended signal peptide-containing protein [Veillonella atypica]|uniref:YadA-like family protein n=1 Tax=Veillonella atypica TaxID=39777 RepID=UPI0023B11172|nr:YadA-like family protein [Veillonella atypica]MDE8713891.1 ESPR-type extended signal peptide-containing protein [Veillonella atypica]
MNKIFKVIWSKSKQCYVVVSEIAKNKTGKKKIVVAGIFAALAMTSMSTDIYAFNGIGATNKYDSSAAGAKYVQGQGLVLGTTGSEVSGDSNTVAIGSDSHSFGSASVAIGGGHTTKNKGNGQIAIGYTTTSGSGAVAIGGAGGTSATGDSAVALGGGSTATGNNAFAGAGGTATGESATAIGSSAIAGGRGGVAIGWNSESAVNAVGIGFNAKAKANNTVAIGVEANSDNSIGDNSSSVSIGVKTRAREVGSMAMGVSADASGKYSIALGSGNVFGDYTATANYPKATGEKAIAIGYDGQALNINATAVGSEAHATGKQSAAYGFKSQASEQDATAIGSNAIASAVRTTALGVNAQALGSNSVAVGGGAGGTNVVGFAEKLNADGGDITRLNRNINIATTAEGDNAVALGYYANAANGSVAIGQTSIAATGGVALGQRVLEDTGNKYASAVVIGQDSTAKGTYSVSLGRQTITKGSTSLAMGNGASANGDYSVAMGRKVVADDTSTAIGHHAYASKGGLAIGAQDNDISADRTTASAKGALAIGKNTKASAEDAVAIGTNAQSTLKGAVALGSGSTTATTATKQTSTTVNGIAYNFAGATSDPNMQVSVGAVGKERQIKNVAAGEMSATSTDAINGSQLFAVASQIKPIQYFAVNSSVAGNKDNSGATGLDSVAIGPKAKAQAVSSIALGNNATAAGGNSIAIGNTSSATDKQSPISIGYGATANGDFSVAIGGGDNNTNYGATANGVGGTALGGKAKTTGGNFQTAVGYGATTTAQNASAFGYNATTSVEGGVALGFNSSSTTGVNKGYNPNDNRTNKYDGLKNNVLTSTTGAIAVGNGSTVTRQITGVAAGTNDTDAVNVAQLKSVNLAFKGNVGSGDVNLATNDSDKKLTIQGDRTYITTNASGNTLTISANKKDIHVTNGAASADAGMADAKNVAEAINKAVSQNAYNWYLTADNDTAGSRATINKEGTVKFSGDSNITVARNNNTITTSLNKAITVDSVKANKTITVGTNKITLDGNTGAVTGKAFTGDSFTAGDNVLSNTTLQIGSPTGANNVSITRDGLTAKAGTKTVKFGTNGIDAGGQKITNVSSGGNVGTNAANITDVKNAVSDVTLKLDTNAKTGNVKLGESPLKVIGANGIRTDLVGTNNGSLVVGLDSNTVNATTKGIGLTGDTGSTGLKYLKDGDASFKVAGDGNLVTTKASATGVQVAVDTAKVKDLAVEAVTVSKANTADNPITVTPTAGTNSKDYAIGIDTTKLAAKTNLAYTANGAAAKIVSLAKGLNFVNGTNTVSSVDSDGKVSFDLTQATKDSINKSATAVGRTITLNADSGTGSSQSLSNGNVSFAVSGATGDYISTTMDGSAVKVSTKRATINSDANTGAASVTGADGLATAKNVASAINSAVNGLSQNLNISDGTKDSSVALKSQKLTVTGTGAAKATVNNQTITVDVAEGMLSNNADGTVKADAAGVATTKNVADVINKTISDNQYSWKLSANGEATTATVGKGGTVDFTGDTNITVDRNNKDISVKLNKNLIDMNSISLGNARGETIFLNGRDGSIKAGKAEFKDNVGAGSTITSDQLSFTNGATGANESTTTIALDTVAIQSGPNSSALTSKYLAFSDEDGNNAEGSAKGVVFQNAAGKLVQFTVDEIKAGGNKIQEVAEGTADTDAVNVKQLKDTIGTQSLTYRANTSADTDAKSVKLSKGLDFVNGTSTVASVDEDGKVSFDLNTATKTQINTNTTDIATNKGNIAINTADIATNKGKIATNTANIATNTTNIAHTIALADDKGTSTTAKSLKDGNVSFNIKGDNQFISTAASGNDVTLTVNEQAIKDAAKSASSFKVKANTHAEEEVKGGDTITFNNGDNIEISQTGKTFTIGTAKNITVDSVTAGNTVINTSGLTNGTTAITGTGITTDKVTVGGISIDKTAGINAGGKVISNVASGTVNNNATDDSNAANIGDVKQAVANLSQNLNITDGTNNGTVNLKNQNLNVAGANGVMATVNNQTITVGLDANTVNATTKGIGLTGDTGSTGNKYLKDGDVSFAVTGDGSLVSTSATAAGVKVVVKSASITAGTDGTITGPTTDGVATAKNVADAINVAKKASKTEITANTGEAANATTRNVTLTSTTAADGHTIYDVKLNDKVTLGSGANAVTIDGTTGAITGKTATIGGVTVNGTANTIGGLSNTTWNGTAVSGRAATEDQLKAVADAAGSQTWEITADKKAGTSGAQTGTKENAKVGKDDKVSLIAGENLTVDQAGKNFTYSLNTDLVKMNSATFEATGGKTTIIKGDSIVQTDGANINTSNATSNTITDGTNTSTITAGKAQIGTVGIDGVASKITTGGANAVVINGADGTAKTGTVTVTGGTTNDITGLSNTSLTGADFATKGRAATEEQLKAATSATTLKFTGDVATNTGSVNLKDDTFGIKGDGKYISTDVNGKNVNLTVSEAEVKKSAVAAVTVSTDTTDANNPLTVTPTTSADGTTKDYKVTIDGTKIANKTNLSYKANDGTAKQVSLADGLNFKNGTLTTASIDDNGVVKYDVNTASITAGADGTITGPTTDGVATAQNVVDAINAAKKASKTEITANTGEAANATTGNVTLTSTTAADGHTIYDVKLNDKVTLGSGANAVTVDGTAAKVTAGVTTVDGATGTITTGGTNSIKVDGATGTVTGLTNKDWTPGVTKAVTGRAATEDQLQKVADAASSQTWNITADKAGTTGAQTGTKKNATVGKDETVELVAGDNLTINQNERKFTYSLNKDLANLTSVSVGTGTTETIKLDGATGKITAKNAVIGGVTVDGDNNHVTGLSNTTWNGTATTGRAATEDQLKAVAETAKTTTDAVNLKFTGDTNTSPGVVNLKDDTFGIVGDGKYVSTDANGKNLTVKVSEAEVKKSAVAAVTVSTDTTDANNPLTVTPTTSADGTTKDYKVTIDGTKIANKTNLSYKANDGTAKQVSLADGLNFKNGTLTTASIDDAGVVKYDVNTAAITAGADGTITGPTTDGVATAQNVADAINAAKKASKTEITANTGEAANTTTGNVTLTSTTAADGHTIYDVKLNDKVTLGSGANAVTIDGTAGKATIGSSVINGVNNTFTTGGAKTVTLDGATGTITGTTANIGGVTVNGTANTIGGLSNTTWNGTATTGRAATEDQLKAVADAAGSQTWEITADKDAATSGAQTGTKKNAKVGKDDKVQLIAGENLTVNQNERDFTYSLNKDLVKMNSATFEATGGKTTVIKGDSIVQTDGANVNTSNTTSNTITDGTNTSAITAGKGQIGSVGIDGIVSKITTGGANAVVINGADGTIKTGTVTVTGGTTNDITGLSNTTVTAADFATKGRAATEEQLKAATGATTLKFTGDVATNTGSVNLKDDIFGIKGDNKYISTDVNGKNVNLTVSEAEVKKSAVAAVTVSTDTTDTNNPLTVTPTTSADGTTKDYKVTIDGTKIANKTNLSYKANDGTAKQVSLADGLNFKNGTLTTASIDDNGVVKYDVNTASITAGTDGTITGPTTDGVATAQNVADAINAAKKASKTEITANTGEAANATTGNVTLTSTTAADGHTIYDVKLNDKVTLGSGANAVTIDGTAGKATIGSSIVDGVNSTFTTGGANAVKLDGAAGTIKTGTVTVTGGTTNDITGLSNTTVTSADFATKGRAATEEQLKAVGEQTWQITADKDATTSGAQTGTKKNAKVGKDDKVQLIAGENLTVNQNERDFTYSLNKDLVKMNSATFEATGGRTTVIKGDSIVQTDGTKVNTSTAGGSTVADGTKSTETTADGQVIKDGAKSNKSTVDSNVIDDGNGNVNTSNAKSNTITDGTNTSTVTAGKAQIGTVGIDGVASKITTGGANAVVINGADGTVKTGTVTVIGGTTNDITGLSNTTVTAADFATKGRAATEEQLKAVGEQTWQITADKDATTSGVQTGTKKDAKVGKDDKVQLIAGENLTVNQNERDFTYSLNKDLVKMNSATFEATGGKTTVIKGDSIVQTDGTKVNTSTAAGNTVVDGAKSTATTADGTTVTTANGNTNYAADGVRINTTGKTPVSLTDAGLDNGNNVIKNVASGHVNNDATDNTNAANIADVKKATTTVTANAGEAANATTGNVTLTSTTAADGHTIYDVKLNDKVTLGSGANAVTIDGTVGKATFGSSVVDGVNNTFTTGGANAVKLDGAAGTIKTGTVTVTGGTTNDITGLSNTTVTAADFATKGRAATEEQLKAVGEQTWQITADKDATTSGAQTGTKKDAKVGKNDKVQLIAGENMTVNQNERDFTFTLNKDLVKMNSATFEATGGKTTVIKGDSIVQTDGTKVNTSTAGGNTVADGTKSTETTADGQVIKDGAKTNTSTVDENTLVDGAKSNKATVDSNVVDDGNGNVNTSNATSNTITDGTNRSTITAGKATIGSSVIDGVNNTFTTGGANAVKLDGTAGTIKTGTVTVTGGTTNDITGLSNATVTSADFATKGRAATEEQLKAVGEQTWQITADKDATTSGAQTGTKKDAKVGKDDKVQLIAGENMTVNQNERDFTFTLNKDLVKMNSATFLGTGSNTTVITGNSITQTAGTQTNTSTAGGNTVADGTKSTETTADGQVIKDGTKSNKSTVDSNVIDDGNGNVNTSNATSNTITDGTNTTATTSSSVTVKDNAGNSTVITKDNVTTGVGGNKITLDGTAGKATVGASVVDGVNNTFTTGGANAVKLDGAAGTIKTGTVTVTGGTTNDITGLSNTTVNSADFATKGRAATEEQLKAVGEQTWQITANKDATTSGVQTGTKKDAKVGKDDKVQLIAGENMTVNQNERDFTFTLNKDLVKMNSATFLGTGSNTTVITGNSITQTAGAQTNTSTAAGNTIANGTKSTETTADGQVIKDGAKSNKSTVDSNVIDDGNGNVNTSNATSNTITDGTNTSTITAGKANIGNIAVDGVNNKITVGTGANPVTLDGANGHLDGLTNTTWVPGVTKATTGRAATEDQLQQVSDAVGAGWKVNTGTVAGSSGVSNGAASTKVSSGEEVKLQAGDNLVIDQNGKTVSYSLNKDLTKMNSATFEATGGKTTVIKGDSIVQTDGGKTNTSNAAGNTVVDGNKSTATTAAGITITDGAGNTNTATATSNNLADNAGNSNVSNATSNTLKNAAGDETKADAKGVTVKDAAGNNATFTKDGITITKTGKDTVSLTSDGLDNGKNKIVNVAAGVANTDAVNVGQLKEYAAKSTTELTANNGETAGSTTGNIVLTKTTAADGHTIYDNKLNDKITLGSDPTKAVTVDGTTGMVTGLTNKTWTPGSIVSGRAATEDQLKEAVADSGWKAAVDKEGSGQSTVVGTSPEKIKAEETVTFKAGNNMMVTQTGKSISYAVNPELTNMTSATFKDAAGNTTVTNGNGITITPGSANPTNPHAGPVSLTKDGLNNGNNQIKGVAPGTDPTDAVNVSQLNTSNANTSQAINQIAGEVQHVGAHAAAMAALKPIQYDPLEPTQVMAGVGNYRGETAAALGLAHYTNENTMFNVGVSVGGNHNMVNAGVTHKFGYSPEKKNIPDRYKAGPISSVYVMQDEVSSLKKENAEQKYVIADQAARLTTLEAENEQQRRELAETKKGLDDLKAAVDKLLASKG